MINTERICTRLKVYHAALILGSRQLGRGVQIDILVAYSGLAATFLLIEEIQDCISCIQVGVVVVKSHAVAELVLSCFLDIDLYHDLLFVECTLETIAPSLAVEHCAIGCPCFIYSPLGALGFYICQVYAVTCLCREEVACDELPRALLDEGSDDLYIRIHCIACAVLQCLTAYGQGLELIAFGRSSCHSD